MAVHSVFDYLEIDPSIDSYMDIPVALDERFDVYVNDIYYTTLFTMPSGVIYGVIGNLVRDGIIRGVHEVSDMDVDHKRKRIDVRLSRNAEIRRT